MRTTNLVLGAITAAALLSTAACGGGTVTIRPADAASPPTSAAAAATSAPATGSAGFSIGSDGTVTAGDGTGAGFTAGPGGFTATDGTGNGLTAGPGGFSAQSSPAPSDPALRATASDIVTFCAAASRYGTANLAAAKSLAAGGSADSGAFAATLVTMADGVAEMRRTGPPSLRPDLDTLATTVTAIDDAFVRNGRDLGRLAADGSVEGIASAAEGAFDRLDTAATGVCQ